jgi:hypothetical protein
MAVDYDKLATNVVNTITKLINRTPITSPTTIVPAELIVRDSTCPFHPPESNR